jgi:ComEC/Rec2-related protein
MHLSILALLIVTFLKPLGGKGFAEGGVVLGALVFLWFAGLSPSLNRSCIMLLVFYFVKRYGLRSGLLDVLGCSFVAQLLLFPTDVITIACILSYGALTGIALISGHVEGLCKGYLPPAIASSLGASLGAQSLTIPVSALVFALVPTAGIPASMVISPLVTLFFISGSIILIICLLCPPLMGLGLSLLEVQYTLIDFLARSFARLPVLKIRDLSGILTVCILSFAMSGAIVYISRRLRLWRMSDAGFARL